jgi:hypothetical protein
MKVVKLRLATVAVAGIAVALLAAGAAWSADPAPAAPATKAAPAPSKETREKMAVLHEQMAACLRSDKSLSECHAQMMKSCHESLGANGCPMGMGHMGHGKQGGPSPKTDEPGEGRR